jgi:PAS domain S-box-containing protein
MSEMKEKNITGDSIFQQIAGLGQWIVELEETVAQLKSIDISVQEMMSIAAGFANGLQQGLALVQDGNILWANAAACKMLGYQIEEVINTSAIVLASADYRGKLAARLNDIQAGEVLDTYDAWPLMTKNRVVKQIKAYADCIVYDGKPAVLTILVDVTEEQALQDELSLRSQMLDSVSDSVFLLDMNGNLVYVNKEACGALGYTSDEMTKMNIMDINAPELKRRAGVRLNQVTEHKETRFKTIHTRRNGSRMPVVVRVKLIRWHDRQFILGLVREEELVIEDEI